MSETIAAAFVYKRDQLRSGNSSTLTCQPLLCPSLSRSCRSPAFREHVMTCRDASAAWLRPVTTNCKGSCQRQQKRIQADEEPRYRSQVMMYLGSQGCKLLHTQSTDISPNINVILGAFHMTDFHFGSSVGRSLSTGCEKEKADLHNSTAYAFGSTSHKRSLVLNRQDLASYRFFIDALGFPRRSTHCMREAGYMLHWACRNFVPEIFFWRIPLPLCCL